MRQLILAAVLMLMAHGSVAGGFYRGNDLVSVCDGTKSGEPRANPSEYNACVRYLGGIADATDAWTGWGDLRSQVCIPEGASLEQLRQVYMRYIRERPETWHLYAGGGVLNAYLQAWPCK